MQKIRYYYNNTIDFIWGTILIVVFAGSLIGGPALLFYQIFRYLKDGEWISYSFLNGLEFLGGSIEQWVLHPADWVGLHTLFGKLPLSLSIVIVGFIISAMLYSGQENFRRERNLKN